MTREESVEKALNAVADREESLGTALNDAATKKHAFKMKEAEEFLKAEGGADLRKMIALKNCRKEYEEYLKAEAVATFTRQKMDDAFQALSARQSLLSYEARLRV